MSKEYERAQALADHYIDLLSEDARISKRPLFGAVALYRGEHAFAMVWHGALYFKVDDKSQAEYEAAKSHTLGYKSEGADRSLKSFWEVPADVVDDTDKLRKWAQRSYRASLRTAQD